MILLREYNWWWCSSSHLLQWVIFFSSLTSSFSKFFIACFESKLFFNEEQFASKFCFECSFWNLDEKDHSICYQLFQHEVFLMKLNVFIIWSDQSVNAFAYFECNQVGLPRQRPLQRGLTHESSEYFMDSVGIFFFILETERVGISKHHCYFLLLELKIYLLTRA